VRAVPDLASVRFHGAKEQPQQRRLAAAVRADQPNAIAADDPSREVSPDVLRSEALADVVSFEHRLTRTSRRLDLQADGSVLLTPSRAFLAHRHQRAHAALVTRPAGFDALTQPRFLFRKPLIELLVGDRLVGQRLVLPSKEGRVIARPRRQMA